MKKACVHTMYSAFSAYNMGIIPSGWNFVIGSMLKDSCISMSHSMMRLNLPVTVSTTLAVYMCGQK